LPSSRSSAALARHAAIWNACCAPSSTLAVGPEGAQRHDAPVAAIAQRLGGDWVRAAGLFALIGRLVVAGEADRLPGLETSCAGGFAQ
jgi:hypothetical protein